MDYIKDDVFTTIGGKKFKVRELTLAQKNKLLAHVGDPIRKIASNAFFKKKDGIIAFDWADEVSLAELDIDKIILASLDATDQLLKLAIPDFKDWDNLPESMAREALKVAVEVQDFKGYIATFFSLAKSLFR